ncbi:hypothetical protein BDR06DRAFT_971925 [Suillus hirtellus]|nr:hypothetical protein BDR06DRAFT_971925 [Suillus hirtellus]
MQAYLTHPTREPSPDYQGRKGRGLCTTGPVVKQDSVILSKTSSRHISQMKSIKPPRLPPSSDTPYDSSDDDIIGPITPPPILHDLSSYAKHVRQRVKPYHRGPNIIDHLCGEECVGCYVSKDALDVQRDKSQLHHRMERLSPEALAQAVVAVQANIEWRHGEMETYINAASEPLNTAIEVLSSSTSDELVNHKNCSIAAYEDDAMLFATADTEFDQVQSFACMHFIYLQTLPLLNDHYKQCLFFNQMIAPPVWMKKSSDDFSIWQLTQNPENSPVRREFVPYWVVCHLVPRDLGQVEIKLISLHDLPQALSMLNQVL